MKKVLTKMIWKKLKEWLNCRAAFKAIRKANEELLKEIDSIDTNWSEKVRKLENLVFEKVYRIKGEKGIENIYGDKYYLHHYVWSKKKIKGLDCYYDEDKKMWRCYFKYD